VKNEGHEERRKRMGSGFLAAADGRVTPHSFPPAFVTFGFSFVSFVNLQKRSREGTKPEKPTNLTAKTEEKRSKLTAKELD
jgi:hypothetical protein